MLEPRAPPQEEPEQRITLPPRNTKKSAQSHVLLPPGLEVRPSRLKQSDDCLSPLGKLERTVKQMGEAAAAAAFTAPVFCHEAREDIQFWASELGPHRLAWEVHAASLQGTSSTPQEDFSCCASPTLATSLLDSDSG